MASREIQKQVKDKLLAEWLPDKPGGLKGLVNMAADAALAVLGERVEFLEGEVHAFENPGYEYGESIGEAAEEIKAGQLVAWNEDGKLELAVPLDPDTDLEPGDDAEDAATHPSGIKDSTMQALEDSRYLCPQCAVVHQRDSGVGTRHAHLFYGGTPVLTHLEHCPKLGDPEDGVCNCNAEGLSVAERAGARRPGDGFR